MLKVIALFILCAFVQCKDNKNITELSKNNHDYFEEFVKDLSLDSLKYINGVNRDGEFITLIYLNIDDSSELRLYGHRTDKLILFKHDSIWIQLDSLDNYYNLDNFSTSIAKIKFDFTTMEKLQADRIIYEKGGVAIKKDSISYLHFYDTTLYSNYTNDSTMKRIDNNWLVKY